MRKNKRTKKEENKGENMAGKKIVRKEIKDQ
jgi:hypothetical protein